MKPLIQLGIRTSLFVVALLLGCFGVWSAPNAFGVVPTPDGGYPGGNTAEGQNALFSLTTGGFNTGVGFFSLRSDATNSFNTAVGAGTLLANIADRNTATGAGALFSNTTGTDNTANGVFALFHNSEGLGNTAVGGGALFNNIGEGNTAIGLNALFSNTTGSNTAVGVNALHDNTTGHDNTAVGNAALNASTGSFNTAIGLAAGYRVTTANNVIAIDTSGENVSNSCFIGNIRDVTTAINDAVPVVIDSADQLGTVSSSRRFKKDITSMDKASEAILALKPVTFHYKSDTTNRPEFGLIAEEVAEVNPNLVVRDKNDEIYTVRYDAVNAMLLNEFLKEHRKNEQQEATIARQQKQIDALTAGLQKVSAQLEVSKAAPRAVVNNQ